MSPSAAVEPVAPTAGADGLAVGLGDGSAGRVAAGVGETTTTGTGDSSATVGALLVGVVEGVATHAATTAASATGSQRRRRFPSGIMQTIRDTLRDGFPPPEDLTCRCPLSIVPPPRSSVPSGCFRMDRANGAGSRAPRAAASSSSSCRRHSRPRPSTTVTSGAGSNGCPRCSWTARAPTGRELLARLASFWLPSEAVLFVGSTTGSIAGRAAAMARTELGERKPAPSGNWLHALSDRTMLRIWWASTDAPEEYEDALLSEFADGVSEADRAALPDATVILPWANLRTVTGERKADRDRESARAGHLASPAATGHHDRRPAARRGRWSP